MRRYLEKGTRLR